MLTYEMKRVIRDELLNDPKGRGYAGKTPDEIVELINHGYTVTVEKSEPVTVDVVSSAVHKVIVPTGELYDITELSKLPRDGSAKDQAIKAAWSFVEMLTRWETIETSNAATWEAAQKAMGALQMAGVLSADSVKRITALVVQQAAPKTTTYDARIFRIFIENPVNLPDNFTAYAVTADDVKECMA